jgi:regulator of sigma E protease
VAAVSADSPAQIAGLKEGDKIVSLGGQAPGGERTLNEITADLSGKTVELKFVEASSGKVVSKEVTLREKGASGGVIGVQAVESVKFRSTWSAPVNALTTMYQSTEATFRGVAYAVSNLVHGNGEKASEVVGGPVATVDAIKGVSETGLVQLVLLIALISLSLGIMNILPIPALDGGRLFLILLFRLRGKVLTKEKEESINAWGMGFLLLFVALITVVDIGKIF